MDRDDRPAAAPQARPQIFRGRRLFVITDVYKRQLLDKEIDLLYDRLMGEESEESEE